jgi:hypothetical protein
MKLKDLAEALPGLSEEDREKAVKNAFKKLTPISNGELYSFQDDWDFRRPYEEYRKAQDEVVRRCLLMELSDFGNDVRSVLKLEPINPEEELLP